MLRGGGNCVELGITWRRDLRGGIVRARALRGGRSCVEEGIAWGESCVEEDNTHHCRITHHSSLRTAHCHLTHDMKTCTNTCNMCGSCSRCVVCALVGVVGGWLVQWWVVCAVVCGRCNDAWLVGGWCNGGHKTTTCMTY